MKTEVTILKVRKPGAPGINRFWHFCAVIFVMGFITTSPARADLYLTDDPTFGPDSVTVDTSTDLGWLNLSETAGLSYGKVSSEMQPGGTFSGFRFATVQEVLGLYSSAGIPGTGIYSLSTPAIPSFLSMIGMSGTINGYPGVLALTGTPYAGAPGFYCAPAIYAFGNSGIEEYMVNDGDFKAGGAAYGSTASYPNLSSWLVEEVPEPANGSFLILITLSWRGFMHLHRRKKGGELRAYGAGGASAR